ncbi:hypothetical protein SAMN05216312_111198 [Cohnella sp. OV330]|uniref:hypothetical protein n=1 Tax=Cohnella sp. OV330 TaxID=1855288 RepID=UPI0008E437FC|nr:hypothetical protein [Cohnella sp. OV330]SFB52424.1 hypothetical protein SAMN05216312_111198 [Cohnella sp. OV330]
METLRVVDKQFDTKLGAISISITMSIRDYLMLCGDRIKNSHYQRRVLPPSRNKVFKRLIQDLKEGCTIPTISLAILSDKKINYEDTLAEIETKLKPIHSEEVSILDGIQRTNCLLQVRSELKEEQLNTFLSNKLRLELWVNISMMSLLYRMVALNAGQTAMTLRHQLEILHTPLKGKLSELIPELELFEEGKEVRKRVKSLQYQFADVIEGFMSFIQGDPEIDKQNEVAQRLERIEFLESHSNRLDDTNNQLETFAFIIGDLDLAVCEKYEKIREWLPEYSGSYSILASVPTLTGICAAWGKGYLKYGSEYMRLVSDGLLEEIKNGDLEDPLFLRMFSEIKQGSQTKRIGEFERRLVYRAFLEYIEEQDPTQFDNYWGKALRREGE